jgi:hypothetical protein
VVAFFGNYIEQKKIIDQQKTRRAQFYGPKLYSCVTVPENRSACAQSDPTLSIIFFKIYYLIYTLFFLFLQCRNIQRNAPDNMLPVRNVKCAYIRI